MNPQRTIGWILVGIVLAWVVGCLCGCGDFIVEERVRQECATNTCRNLCCAVELKSVAILTNSLCPGEQYTLGVNDALMGISMLNLELQIDGERKTFGEMGDIVRKRLGVKQASAGDGRGGEGWAR
jgi:hypothetical protein